MPLPNKPSIFDHLSAPTPKESKSKRKRKAKGLIPVMTKSGEIMWVHPDIVNDEQWESSKPKLKGKSCNAVSMATNNDAVTIASLNDSEEEKLALAAQPPTSQPVGTQSEKSYL